MINKDRIVPIEKMDLLTMVGTVMALAGTTYAVIAAADVDGNFTVTGSGAAGNKLANAPLKTVNFASGVTSGTVYFVPAFDFGKILVNGAAATLASASLDLDEVKADGCTLYSAALSSGEVTITAVSPAL